jgi:hypothetical protein
MLLDSEEDVKKVLILVLAFALGCSKSGSNGSASTTQPAPLPPRPKQADKPEYLRYPVLHAECADSNSKLQKYLADNKDVMVFANQDCSIYFVYSKPAADTSFSAPEVGVACQYMSAYKLPVEVMEKRMAQSPASEHNEWQKQIKKSAIDFAYHAPSIDVTIDISHAELFSEAGGRPISELEQIVGEAIVSPLEKPEIKLTVTKRAGKSHDLISADERSNPDWSADTVTPSSRYGISDGVIWFDYDIPWCEGDHFTGVVIPVEKMKNLKPQFNERFEIHASIDSKFYDPETKNYVQKTFFDCGIN